MLFTIREYGVIEDKDTNAEMIVSTQLDRIKVPSSVFDYLCELAGQYKKNGIPIFEIEGRRTLKVDNYVGIISTPCGHTIEILPKHADIQTQDQKEKVLADERLLLRKILEALWKLPSAREVGEASLEKLNLPLSEWIVSRFLQECNRLFQRGLRSEYQCIAEQSAYLKGKLNIQRYLTQPVTEQHRFPIEHDIFSLNTAPNLMWV